MDPMLDCLILNHCKEERHDDDDIMIVHKSSRNHDDGSLQRWTTYYKSINSVYYSSFPFLLTQTPFSQKLSCFNLLRSASAFATVFLVYRHYPALKVSEYLRPYLALKGRKHRFYPALKDSIITYIGITFPSHISTFFSSGILASSGGYNAQREGHGVSGPSKRWRRLEAARWRRHHDPVGL
jgi:hypothetical protein